MATKSTTKIYPATTSSVLGLDSMAQLSLQMKSTMTAQLNQSNPSQAYLLVEFTRTINVDWNALSNVAVEALTEYAAAKQAALDDIKNFTDQETSFDVERFKDTFHAKVSLRKSVASTCPPKIESDVSWVPPMADVEMKTLKKTMGKHAVLMVSSVVSLLRRYFPSARGLHFPPWTSLNVPASHD